MVLAPLGVMVRVGVVGESGGVGVDGDGEMVSE